MKATTLNENEKNQTLSAKKQKTKKATKATNKIRHILATPNKYQAFNLTEEQCIEFRKMMLKYHKYTPVPKANWSVLQKLSKEERKELRTRQKVIIPSRSSIALGFNEVTKSLENKIARIVIISDNITPDMILRHIYKFCDLYNIPLLKVNNFKEITKECFGFSSMMMSFNEIKEEDQINNFYKYVQYSFVNEYVSLKDSNEEERDDDVSMEIETITTKQNENPILLQTERKYDETSRINPSYLGIHLFRSSMKKRAFNPQLKNERFCTSNADFISLDGIVRLEEKHKEIVLFPKPRKTKSKLLKALRIKKLVGNQYRKLTKK